MKLIYLLLIALLAIVIGACGGAATEPKKDKAKDSAKTEKKDDSAKTDKTTSENKDSTEKKQTSDSSVDSPTQAVTDFARAYEAKDVAALKKRFSSKSLETMEKGAKQLKTSLDDQLKNFIGQDQLPFKGVPDMRNEEIIGDTATLEVKTENGWDKMPLVKEDGIWKIAFEKGKQ